MVKMNELNTTKYHYSYIVIQVFDQTHQTYKKF